MGYFLVRNNSRVAIYYRRAFIRLATGIEVVHLRLVCYSLLWMSWAEVVAQLVDWLLLTSQVRNSNPVIGKLYITYILSNVLNRQKQTKKRQGIVHFSKGGGVKLNDQNIHSSKQYGRTLTWQTETCNKIGPSGKQAVVSKIGMAEKFIKHELEKYKICFFEYQRKSNKNNKRNAKNERKRAKKILQIC